VLEFYCHQSDLFILSISKSFHFTIISLKVKVLKIECYKIAIVI